ncbi:MAG: putative membrane protein [Gammaproteobacteria bacterium]|jgi:uncharacterized membrane protein
MSLAIALHTLAAILWVGGMFFAYVCLRPSMGALDPPVRCRLWREALGRFFTVVWACVAILLISGFAMIGVLGGMAATGLHVHLMTALGLLMMALFMHVQFGPFRKLKLAVDAQDWAEAGKQIGRIRPVVAANLMLGLIAAAAGSGGRWLI